MDQKGKRLPEIVWMFACSHVSRSCMPAKFMVCLFLRFGSVQAWQAHVGGELIPAAFRGFMTGWLHTPRGKAMLRPSAAFWRPGPGKTPVAASQFELAAASFPFSVWLH